MTVNDVKIDWVENMTISKLLKLLEKDRRIIQFQGNRIYIFVNDEILDSNEYSKVVLKKDDRVRMIPVIAGGW